ncbi:hypothetical protein CWE15_03820 [Aliidiomarina taiwanensis]|uniref:DUF3185 domain-containing protein n=1 Tax=Aliidiomarina taiwanensis TaxID=946228 RepID=A0A432XA77_9GAMM|nr:DUF3185 family protein [Aliidiomarina taiwanensis]RUO44308.1 hypothetical protein CWE15_03820 [Aliidiomarina taiwanensis]
MNKAVSVAILVVGLILLYFGWQEKQSVSSQVTEAITNQPTDNSMMFLIGGAVAVIIGLGGVVAGSKK